MDGNINKENIEYTCIQTVNKSFIEQLDGGLGKGQTHQFQ